MLTLTRKADYAMVAMADLARQAPAVVSTSDMSNRLGIPLPILQIIMTRLVRTGLVTSARGPRGGFSLSRPPMHITLAQIIEAVEGPFRLTVCCRPKLGGRETDCDIEDVCPIRDPIWKVNTLIENCLNSVTLTKLVYDQVQTPLGLPKKRKKLSCD